MNDLIQQIKLWSISHKLDKSDPFTQLAKITEELGELARALLKNDTPNIIDALGDTVVVLTILSQQLGLELKDCVKVAYGEIKGRKGNTKNGIFIKEEK